MIRMTGLLVLVALLGLAAGRADAQGIDTQNEIALFGAPLQTARAVLAIDGSTDTEVFAPILEAFAKRVPDVAIRYREITTNELYDLAERGCSGAEPAADLVVSSSIDQQVKLANDGCAQPNHSAAVSALPAWAKWRDEVVGLTYEPAVIVYNRDLVAPAQVPRSRFDLIDLLRPADNPFNGRIGTYDIEASGVGYLFAFVDAQQATTFGRLIEAFGRNKVVATCCSAEIIDDVASGRFLIAYNMLGSYALVRAAEDHRIGIVAPSDYTLILSRAALIPKRAKNAELARQFIDFALSGAGRRSLSESGLLVSFDDAGGGLAALSGAVPTLRPIALSPALLIGLDRQTRDNFLALWRSSLGGADPEAR
ncbi:ABC transporter substrate-binding protein [Dongia deserti]|uniref:ABC transporter substrate-binding protein n=1 Tax=Dongia deserti TaxID=2268030 RepID=UPI00254796AA|nr:ABC transporter substrate-binding protein [Dongia deserti]